MNLWLRLVCYLVCRGVEKMRDTLDTSFWHFRVWLTDMDVNGHVNNGRFLELMDLGRFDFFWRSPLRASIFALRSVPILGGVIIRYRMPLDFNRRITLETKLLGFEDNWMVIEQRFVFKTGDRAGATAAIALCKCGFYDRKQSKLLDPATIFAHYKIALPTNDLPPMAMVWREADLALKKATQ